VRVLNNHHGGQGESLVPPHTRGSLSLSCQYPPYHGRIESSGRDVTHGASRQLCVAHGGQGLLDDAEQRGVRQGVSAVRTQREL
jgi:hypothetical protein